MLKFNLGLHLNLSKLSLLGLANLFFLPVLGVYSAYGQQLVSNAINYSCQSYQGGFSTMGRSSLGARPIVTWDNRQPICNTVSERFQIARDNGNLIRLMREGRDVCGTNRDGGECRAFLFSTDSAENANGLWRRLMNNETIPSRFITQSPNAEYFNIELYLETVPISTNPEISTNQLPPQP